MRTFRFPSRSSSQLRRALIGDEKSPIFPAKGNRHEKALPHSHSVRASELECVLKCPRRRCAGDPIPRIGGTVLRGRSSVRQCAAAVGCPDSSDGVTVLRPQTWWSVPSCPRVSAAAMPNHPPTRECLWHSRALSHASNFNCPSVSFPQRTRLRIALWQSPPFRCR